MQPARPNAITIVGGKGEGDDSRGAGAAILFKREKPGRLSASMAIFRKPGFNADGGGGKKNQIPGGLFVKCPTCDAMIHHLELTENQQVCPHCDHHFSQKARERIECLLDHGSFQETCAGLTPVDILEFRGAATYSDRLKTYQKRTGLNDSVVSGMGSIEARPVSLAVMDFEFLGGSMGSVAGEKITRAIETATERRWPVVIVSASGGARLYEGMFSLMQMAKTAGALAYHAQARLPFVSVLTHPTTGGVTASFATLGDLILAEPKAQIGFAGPRVIKETTHQDLPPGFQTAEFLEAHGLVDVIVHRKKMRATLASLLAYLAPAA